MTKPHATYIDIAKAICIVLVVIGHYKPSTSPAYWNTLVDIIYTFHMPLFMFASGFIYKQFTSPIYTLKQYSYFIKSKIHRLAIPYLATSTIIITIKIVMGHYITIDNPCTFNSYIEMLYQPSAGYFLWFLYVLFLIFIIIPIFQSRKSQTLLWFIALILFLLPLEFPHVFCLNQLKKYLLFFVSGIMLGNTKNILNYPIWHKYITIPILLLFINIIAVPLIDYTTSSFIQIKITQLFLAFNGIFCILWISRYLQEYRHKLLLIIARSSFIIYLLHTTFEGLCRSALFVIIPSLSTQFLLSACIIILAGTIIPILLDKYIIRRYALTKYLFGIK